MHALVEDPSRRDIAWKLNIDADVTSIAVRQVEVRNWLAQQVLASLRR